MPGTKICTRYSICPEQRLDGNGEIFSEEMQIDDTIRFVNCTRNYPQLSSSSSMSQNSKPIVYQRRSKLKKSAAVSNVQQSDGTKRSDACTSANGSEAPLLSPQEHPISVSEFATGVRSPIVHPVATIDANRILNACNANANANDNCSSSKSNLGLNTIPLKIDVNEAGECSSSGGLTAVPPQISQRDISILILRTQGLLDESSKKQNGAFTERSKDANRKKNYCSKSCRVCKQMDNTSNMLICDNCQDAFHISCCSPRIAILPVNEWLCSSCLKKKHKILKDKDVSTETGRNKHLASELDLGSLEVMLRDTEPYMSNVRIGNEFQADVPDWCGPVNKECDLTGGPLENNSYYDINMQEGESISIKPSKLDFIGNWLQCREVIREGVHEKICGKWRRAPLYEVQTDKWECFRCVLWDPVHADCAVPQELDTDEIMKQLKYVEMLKPRLSAKKRRKLGSSKGNGSQ